jgi:hypothetical protein
LQEPLSVAQLFRAFHAQAKPLAYVITEVEILDQAAFNEFSPKVPATMHSRSVESISFVGERLSRSKVMRRSALSSASSSHSFRATVVCKCREYPDRIDDSPDICDGILSGSMRIRDGSPGA